MFKMANAMLNFEQWCQTFEQKLVDHQQRLTPQRRTIARILFAEEGRHLNVDELHQEVRQQDSSVGYATVYRTLKLLEEHELVHSNKFGDGTRRYEIAYGAAHHHDHLICTECGRIVEFQHDQIEHLQNEIAAEHGYQLTDHRMVLFGLCDDH